MTRAIIVGYIDRLGYLRCTSCARSMLLTEIATYVYADSAPHSAELCDRCGKPVMSAARACGLCARAGTNDFAGPRAHSPSCPKSKEGA